MLVTRAIGRCSDAPADAFTAVPVSPAARRSGMMMPSAPAPSARANQRTQIVRIFHAIEHDQEAVLAVPLLQQRVHVGVLLAGGNGDDALMGVRVGGAVEFLALQKAHLHAAGAAIVDNALHPLIVPLARDADVIEAAPARLQRLADRMNSVDNDHICN